MTSPGLPLGSSEFAQGAIRYSDAYPGDTNARIVIPISCGYAPYLTPPIQAILDTGAPWCVFDPQITEMLEIDYAAGIECRLWIRGLLYHGWLCNLPVKLEAEDDYGTGITLEATVFIPRLNPGQDSWPHPNFLGLGGFLERIRFAVDPENNLFYFGSLTGK